MLKYFLYFVIGILNFQLLYRTLKSYFLYAKKSFILGIFYFLLLYRTRKNPKIISYMLNNNFSYIQLSFFFLLQKDSYLDHDDTDAFFLFLLQKDFGTFHVLLFEAFLCFFWYLFTIFYIYIYKKIYKNILISFST